MDLHFCIVIQVGLFHGEYCNIYRARQ